MAFSVRGIKDGAIAISLKAFVNDKFAEYGEITDLAIDTQANRLTAKAMMRGERESVSATVEKYEILRECNDNFIVLCSFSSSRTWLTILLNKLFSNKRYKLPGTVSKFL